ncbi:MAG: membrane protein insertase YidC [Verrucomicrobiota bacterium]|jgi:YidC/Oxa1 family membrane protein insertase
MDRTGIIVITICVILLALSFYEQLQHSPRQVPAATNIVTAAQTTTTTAAGAEAPPAPPVLPAFLQDTNLPEHLLMLSNREVRYTFTSRGGGLKLVELLDYPETISARWRTQKGSATNAVATLNTRAPLPAFTVLGGSNLIGNGDFTLSPMPDGVRAEKALPDGLRLVKEFHLGSNYLLNATVRFENTSATPLAVPAQEIVVGTATPMDVDDTSFSYYGGSMWFDGANPHNMTISWFSGAGFGCVRGTPRSEFVAGATNVYWAASHNQFFTLLAMTATNAPAEQVIARPVTLPAFAEQSPGMPAPQGIQTALLYPAQTVSANSSVERQIVLFAGPKEYRTLADIGAEFQNHADDVMGFTGFFGLCAKPLLLTMNWLHDVTRIGYGWVIVLITFLLRAIFWPLMAASTRSMKRMQALGPEVQALKEKYKDDPQKFTQKQMELWKKHKVSPVSGCLPMLIQMPVFIGFFTMLRSAIELRGAHFLWVADLSKPDTLFLIPGIDFPFNLLPLLMGGAMLWQSHLTPPSPGMDPTQAKMMRYLPLIFLVFLYSYSGGLALYMTVSTLLGILQTKLTKNLRDPAAVPAGNPALTPVSKKKK